MPCLILLPSIEQEMETCYNVSESCQVGPCTDPGRQDASTHAIAIKCTHELLSSLQSDTDYSLQYTEGLQHVVVIWLWSQEKAQRFL